MTRFKAFTILALLGAALLAGTYAAVTGKPEEVIAGAPECDSCSARKQHIKRVRDGVAPPAAAAD